MSEMASVRSYQGTVTFYDETHQELGSLSTGIYNLVTKDIRATVSSEHPNAAIDVYIGTLEGRRWSLIVTVFWNKKGIEVLLELRGVKFEESVDWLLIGGK